MPDTIDLGSLVRGTAGNILELPEPELERQLAQATLHHHRATLERIVRAAKSLRDPEHAAQVCAEHTAPLLRGAAAVLPRMEQLVTSRESPPLVRLVLLATVIYAAAPEDLVPDSLGAEGFVDDAIFVHRLVATFPPELCGHLGVEPIHDDYLMLLQLAVDPAVIPALRLRLQAVALQLLNAEMAIQFIGPWGTHLLVDTFLQPANLAQFFAYAGDRRTEMPQKLPAGRDPTKTWSTAIHSFPDGGGFSQTESGWFIWD
jgi:hypothetical protein